MGLDGLPCWFGLDMAGTTDLASLAMLWWDDEEDVAYVLWKHWSTVAMSGRLDQHTGGQWRVWADSDSVSLRLFRADWVNAREVAEEIIDLCGRFGPQMIGIDSYRSRTMLQLLEVEAGLPVEMLSQTGRATQAAQERTQAMVAKRRLFHNGDPVARWCAQNTEVTFDGMGFPKIVKRDLDANVRIDAVQALVMAVDSRLKWEREGNVWDTKVFVWDEDSPPSRQGDELVGVGAPSSPVGDVGVLKVRV